MTEKHLPLMTEMTQSISIDPSALLTTSTINALHFPDLTTSGISETSGIGRLTSLNLDGVGMCESMTESFYEVPSTEEALLVNHSNGLQVDTSMTSSSKNLGKKDSNNAQKKRRSRKAQYDATTDGLSLDKIETVTINEEQIEPDDAWLFQVPGSGKKNHPTVDNIFSWVHKEFKENDINATKHRLLCKLDDMSHARTIRSISCHSFPANQRSDSVKRSSTEQQVNPEAMNNARITSPARSTTPLFNGNGNTRPTSPESASPLRHTIAGTSPSVNNLRSREGSREREREPLDYTDLEVMAKVQLENLRQAERQGPLSKRYDQPGTKPPVVPKSTVARNGVKPNNHRRSNTQTITTNVSASYDLPDATEVKPPATNRTNVATPTPTNSNRPRPPVSRPLQSYRGSQTSYNNNNAKVPTTPPASTQKPVKKELGSTFTAKQFASNENGLLNDVSNKPLTTPVRSQVVPQRRTPTQSSMEQIPPSPSSVDVTGNGQSSIPRSSSSLSQGRRSGIPTIGKQQRPGIPTATRTTTANTIPSSQSSDSMMVTRNIRAQAPVTRPQIPDTMSPTSSWNEGCY